jgi:tetratricopeptide (TPR) repeat protein
LKSEEFIANCFSYQLKGQYEEAIKAASEATKLNPNEPQGYNCICTAYAGVKNYSEAIKASTKYIEIMDDRHELSINAVVRHVDFLVKGGMAIEKAIEFLQQYRGKVSPTKIDRYIEFYRKAQ